jgi:hypothetical protein
MDLWQALGISPMTGLMAAAGGLLLAGALALRALLMDRNSRRTTLRLD